MEQNAPNTQELSQEQLALRVLAMAAEGYIKTQDELSRTYVAPQINAALQTLSNMAMAYAHLRNVELAKGVEAVEAGKAE